MCCSHNASGYFTIYGDESLHQDHFEAHLATGDIHTSYARTGYLGFVRRTEMTQSDGGQYMDEYILEINIEYVSIWYSLAKLLVNFPVYVIVLYWVPYRTP